MAQQFTNNARALLTASITNTATSIVIESSKADLFPIADVGPATLPSANSWFKATLQDSTGAVEIVYVRTRTAGSGVLSNVIRGQEGTTAAAFASGTVLGIRVTAADIQSALAVTGADNTFTGDNTFSQPIIASLVGNVTGDVAGDVTGDLTGNVTGNLTGNVTGNVTGDVTGDLVGNADTATVADSTPKLLTTNWTVEETSSQVAFKYGGTTKFTFNQSTGLSFPDGTRQRAAARFFRTRPIAASKTYTVPSDVRALYFLVFGAAGGTSAGSSRGGAGGAGYGEIYIASPASSYAVVIGAAGSISGTAGGTTSVAGVSVTGSGGSTSSSGGAGGVSTGGGFNASGGAGGGGSSGGGGGAGSRAGNGYAGSGGTQGAGGGTASAASGTTPGTAATSEAAGALPIPLGAQTALFQAGLSGGYNDCSAYYYGGQGASAYVTYDVTSPGIPDFFGYIYNRAPGGALVGNSGHQGVVLVIELCEV